MIHPMIHLMIHPTLTRPTTGIAALMIAGLALAACTGGSPTTPVPSASPASVPASAAPSAAASMPAASPTPMASQAPSAAPTASSAPAPSATPGGATIPGATFTDPTRITNPYAPLSGFTELVLEGTEDGEPARSVWKRLSETKAFEIGGKTVQAVIIEDRAYEDDELVEVARDYFAQSDEGTVYYLGEDVDNFVDGKLKDHEGTWLFGRDTQVAGVFMPASPKVGDKFKPEDVPTRASFQRIEESAEVAAVDDTVTVPFGRFTNCVRLELLVENGAKETKWFAPNIGLIKESDVDAELALKSRI